MQKQRGFTLMELMVACAIVGITAAIALPSYRESVLKSNRTDAQISMAGLVTQQERFYFMHNRYTGDFADIVKGAASGASITSEKGLYSITLSLDEEEKGTGWKMEATAINEQAKDLSCAKMSIDSLGIKESHDNNDAVSSDCWR